MLGDVDVAARLMPFAAHFWERSIGPLSANDRTTKRLGAQRTETLWAQGTALFLAEAVQLALTGD